MLYALSKMSPTTTTGKSLNGRRNDDALISQAKAAAAMNPRISRALRELEAAEALLARTKIANGMAAATVPPPPPSAPMQRPSPWLMNSVLQTAPPRKVHTIGGIPPPPQSAAPMVFGIPPAPPLPPMITPDTSPELATHRKSLFPSPPAMGNLKRQTTDDDAMSICGESIASVAASRSEFAMIPPDAPMMEYVDEPRESDILCGRGGKSNHHPGNKKYRLVISRMKMNYRNMGSKTQKTDLSRAIVEHVYGYGGRFLRYDKDSSKYVVLSPAEARKKTSQALREMKEVKWIS